VKEREDKERGRRKKRERRKKRLSAHPQRERAWREDKDDSMERYRAAQISKFVCGRKHGENFSTMCLPTYLVSTVLDNRY
jgi:hypothetical protein